MKKHIHSLLTCAFILTCTAAFNQSYTVSVESRPFEFLSGGEPAVTFTWDDPEFQVPIGFEFPIFDITTSDLYSFQGFIGGLVAGNTNINSLNLLLGFAADLIDRGFLLNTLMSPIYYKTEGSAGQRIFILEYNNAGFYNGEVENQTYVDYINFQIRLYEETEEIEIHIGPYSLENPGMDFDTLPGPAIGLVEGFNALTGDVSGEIFLLSGDALAPGVSDDINSNIIWPIPENTVYTFSPPSTATHDGREETGISFYYPNPCKDHLLARTEISHTIHSPVQIFNPLGKLVLIDQEPSKIDLSDLPEGIYSLRFRTRAGYVTEKISLIH